MQLGLKKRIDFWLGGTLLIILYYPVRIVGLLLMRDHSLNNPKHIAVIKLLGGGSLLLSYPSLVSIKKNYPQIKLSVICSPAIAEFCKVYAIFDDIKILDDTSFFRLVKSSLKILLWMMFNVDITIDLEVHSRLTTVFTTVALVRNRIGLIGANSLWRTRIYTHALYLNCEKCIFIGYDVLAALFGIAAIDIRSAQEIFGANIKKIESKASKQCNNFCVGVGCSDLALERQLPITKWTEVIATILDCYPEHGIIFLGNKLDFRSAESIISLLPQRFKSRLDNFCGQLSLGQSIRVLMQSQGFLGIDSALIHFSRFLSLTTIGFWGPTSPASLLRPLNTIEYHFYQSTSCSPCVHITESPPCQGQNYCMSHDINADIVNDLFRRSGDDRAIVYNAEAWIFGPNDKKPVKYVVAVQVN